MDQFSKFYLNILETNQKYIEEAWEKWQSYIKDTLKKDVSKSYPNGFKDYLIADLNNSINEIRQSEN